MTASTFTIRPGIYQLIPCDTLESHLPKSKRCVALDPLASEVDDDETSVVEFTVLGDDVRMLAMDGRSDHVLLRVDLGDLDPDCSSVMTLYGALSIADHYLLKPADSMATNPEPGQQYAANWLTFETTADQQVSVEGSIIRIGEMEIDPTILGDVEHSEYLLDGVVIDWGDAISAGRTADVVSVVHVARTGDALNVILSEMPRTLDDGVLVIATFMPEQVERIEWIGTPAANAFARDMRSQMKANRSHVVFRPAIR